MAAWGSKPFQNELAQDYISTIVNLHIHPILIEPVECNTNYKKHKWAYYYDRFRAAIELMIMLENCGAYKFAKGYYDLAIEKLFELTNNLAWTDTWDNETHSKYHNYRNDCLRQQQELIALRDKARV